MCAYAGVEGLRQRLTSRLREDEDGGGYGFESSVRQNDVVRHRLTREVGLGDWDLQHPRQSANSILNDKSSSSWAERSLRRSTNPHVRLESTGLCMQLIAWLLAALKSWFFNDGDHDRQAAIEDESLKPRNRECEPVHWNVLEHWSGVLANLAAATQGAFVFLRTTFFSIFQPLLPGFTMLPEWSPLQKERFSKLMERVAVQFDCSNIEHQTSLRALWKAAYPDRCLTGLVSDQWKDMGWQGRDPSTDFRGGGYISLENLLYFANQHPRAFRRVFHKETGKRAEWEYPFAVAGLNVTFMLVDLLGLRSASKVPTTRAAVHFIAYLEEDEDAFDELYCVAFQLLDAQWLAMGASYMEFNSVLKATKNQVEQALCVPKLRRIYDLVTILSLPQ